MRLPGVSSSESIHLIRRFRESSALMVMSNKSPPSTYWATMISRTSTRSSGAISTSLRKIRLSGLAFASGIAGAPRPRSGDLGDAQHASRDQLARRVDVIGDRDRPPLARVFIKKSGDRTERVAHLHHIDLGEIGRVLLVLLQLVFRQRELDKRYRQLRPDRRAVAQEKDELLLQRLEHANEWKIGVRAAGRGRSPAQLHLRRTVLLLVEHQKAGDLLGVLADIGARFVRVEEEVHRQLLAGAAGVLQLRLLSHLVLVGPARGVLQGVFAGIEQDEELLPGIQVLDA